ncbi:MAG: 50S ribosomal protein L44e [Nitrososphaerota archaeon]|jgi:large subunit ribosomal protein L44e|nr:50S ribosomal protein L44e [Nitrososphaerota archaeon]MDG6932449.1 50S ribosomal protein L44e [Nitrososphaerota archaeon]MDG6936059.1 50S ribosomal protein L44e [Nitrososphaerota archaeon]MDG6943703.1 50S ribosomal protein L44e [Nitrososphaerota archaeon]
MKIVSVVKRYCPKCRNYTEHEVSQYRKGKERSMSLGARYHEEVKKGYGGQKYPELKRTSKTTKKVTLRYKCKKCGYTVVKKGMRLRKLEIVEQVSK